MSRKIYDNTGSNTCDSTCDDTCNLIYKAKNKDIEAFLKLTSKYHKIVYAIAYSRTNSPDSAKHLAHKVFIDAFRNIESINTEYSLMQLIFSLTKEICADTGKKPFNVVK